MQHQAHDAEVRTRGSGIRPPRSLLTALRGVDIAELADRLRSEPSFDSDGRNTQTVHDDGHVRVIVSVVGAGREVGARRNDGYLTLTLNEGQGSIRRGADDAVSLDAGSSAIVAPGAEWSYRARRDTTFTAHFWGDSAADAGDAAEHGLA